MEKINRPPLSEISTLKELEENWEKWGVEYIEGKRRWRSDTSLYYEIRNTLISLSKKHCMLCDGYPIGANSRKTIEHYFPKKQYPCFAFLWENLFHCCDTCQAAANRLKMFEYTLKPDNEDYLFGKYFYYDMNSGKLIVYENLKIDVPDEYAKANLFLKRYDINNEERVESRQNAFSDIMNFLKNSDAPMEIRETRDDFAYRYVYDYAKYRFDQQIKQI